ncbi:MAG: Hsp70 family protein [Candidatus Cloacimonadaceae bacterium]|nr:Hsp70 family protein [Candidatus Cloacimonadaceae bacterium]
MAFIDSNGKSELFRIGEDDRPYLPSIFYLAEDGGRYFGDDARFLANESSLGLLDCPLKRSLRSGVLITGNGQKTSPIDLLTLMFMSLKALIKQNQSFSNESTYQLFLTIPVQYGPADEDLLKTAVVAAGFQSDTLSFVREPIAAAEAWFYEQKVSDEYIVVLDCGGGTLDWACLRQISPGRFELFSDIPPDGDNRIGGYDLDQELFNHILTAADNSEQLYCRQNRNLLLEKLRNLKEKACRFQSDSAVKLQEQTISIPMDVMADIVNKRYIRQTILSISPFIGKLKERTQISRPKVLLVGGSAKVVGLVDAIQKECDCEVVIWERSEFATVLGALPIRKETPQVSEAITEIVVGSHSMSHNTNNNQDQKISVNQNNREVKMDDFKAHAQACYAIIEGKASSNQWVQGISGIFGFPFTLAADVGVVPGIYAPLWTEIRSIYGHVPVSMDSAGPVIKNIIPEVLSDLLLDKALGQIPLIGIYFNIICAKHMTWRLGTLFSMMSARGDDIVSDNITNCMKLIRMLFPQQGQFSFTTPDKNAFIRLVTSVSDISPVDYKTKINKGLLAME